MRAIFTFTRCGVPRESGAFVAHLDDVDCRRRERVLRTFLRANAHAQVFIPNVERQVTLSSKVTQNPVAFTHDVVHVCGASVENDVAQR